MDVKVYITDDIIMINS